MASFLHGFADSSVHSFIDSPTHLFIDYSHSVSCAWILSCPLIGISSMSSFVVAPGHTDHFDASALVFGNSAPWYIFPENLEVKLATVWTHKAAEVGRVR